MPHPSPIQPVQLAKGNSLQTSGGQTSGMIRQNAFADKCDGICASRMLADAHTASAVHHHGAQDTVIFAVSGRGTITSEGGKHRVDLEPGDYCLIPAYAEHQEINDGDEQLVLAVFRSGRMPEVVNLSGWGGEPVDS
ncbi:RmlC-like cupin domain-containing protein [Pseudomassariella vexata]|uniref:RmlC-like cupin domain-containing protein n=1 Tax=Pseudomassariella vexata TaxID=1141098 RepID=A0A1Y2DQM0_9PEZI|nr:RmlC-like cupin domain-containing protein [Pseudomassariella vexata]ORY61560.1 RmlC-like cupin domain-containing protein [Pseudomassariella vexata]